MTRDGHRRPLPARWRWARIGEVCSTPVEIRDPRREPGKAFLYVDISSVDTAKKAITATQTIKGEDAPSRARQVIRAGDVVVATTRPNLNAVGLVPPELDKQVCSTGFCVLRSGGDIEPYYLYYFVQSPTFVGAVSDLVRGALYPAVRDSDVRDILVPLSPLDEQRRIAARLSEQMALVDKMRAAARAQVEAARALPAAFLRSVFQSREASAWPWCPLGNVCDFLPARSLRSDGDTPVLVVTTACLSERGFLASGVKEARMTRADAAEATLRPGEILIARSNTPELVGRVAQYLGQPDGVVASDLTIRLCPKGDVQGDFLTAYLSALYVTGHWREKAGGTSGSMKKITRTQLRALPVPAPSAAEQHRVVSELNDQLARASKLCDDAESQLDAANALAGSLIEAVFGGFEPPA